MFSVSVRFHELKVKAYILRYEIGGVLQHEILEHNQLALMGVLTSNSYIFCSPYIDDSARVRNRVICIPQDLTKLVQHCAGRRELHSSLR